MAVKFDTGIIFRKGNTAKLDLVTHKIDFIDGDNYDYKVYNFLSKVSGGCYVFHIRFNKWG